MPINKLAIPRTIARLLRRDASLAGAGLNSVPITFVANSKLVWALNSIAVGIPLEGCDWKGVSTRCSATIYKQYFVIGGGSKGFLFCFLSSHQPGIEPSGIPKFVWYAIMFLLEA
eukprot:1147039-Pelagomonas_calceolata.AAC.1